MMSANCERRLQRRASIVRASVFDFFFTQDTIRPIRSVKDVRYAKEINAHRPESYWSCIKLQPTERDVFRDVCKARRHGGLAPIRAGLKLWGALGQKYKLESHERQQSPQLPSLVNTRGYIKQVTIQNIFSLFSWDRL